MEALKQEAIKVISKLSDTANIDDIMYELYVIDGCQWESKSVPISGIEKCTTYPHDGCSLSS